MATFQYNFQAASAQPRDIEQPLESQAAIGKLEQAPLRGLLEGSINFIFNFFFAKRQQKIVKALSAHLKRPALIS